MGAQALQFFEKKMYDRCVYEMVALCGKGDLSEEDCLFLLRPYTQAFQKYLGIPRRHLGLHLPALKCLSSVFSLLGFRILSCACRLHVLRVAEAVVPLKVWTPERWVDWYNLGVLSVQAGSVGNARNAFDMCWQHFRSEWESLVPCMMAVERYRVQQFYGMLNGSVVRNVSTLEADSVWPTKAAIENK